MSILSVNNLSKSFDGVPVIKGVTFNVEKGKIVGLLGKNGSGKTTIIKLINDLLTVDSGTISVNGNGVGVLSKKDISYLPERSYLDGSKTVAQTFDFFETFYDDFDREKAEKMLVDLGLDSGMKLSKISKGMKEKVQLVLVMSRNVSLYVLDEPLGGVDPVTRDHILQTILSALDENSSMLITTHLISDVETILDEVVFINGGKVVLSGNAEELREQENASINDIFRRIIK